jgi:hypothetical protein
MATELLAVKRGDKLTYQAKGTSERSFTKARFRKVES